MDLLIMKQEALDFFKENLDELYINYFLQDDNKWMAEKFGEDPFVVYKTVQDFKLADVPANKNDIGKTEKENCKIIYTQLKDLTRSQATDERLWAGLCNGTFYGYLRKRWSYDRAKPKSLNKEVGRIRSRFFCSGSGRGSLYRNSLSKCWWTAKKTYHQGYDDPYLLLDIMEELSISTMISDIFYNNRFSDNEQIVEGILLGFKELLDRKISLNIKDIRRFLTMMNAYGGTVVLDLLSAEETKNYTVKTLLQIIQGEEFSINELVEENSDENEDELVNDFDPK